VERVQGWGRRIRNADYTVFEMMSALALVLVWGLLLTRTTPSFASATPYRVWALIAMGVGVLQSGGVATKRHGLRQWASLAASVVWTLVSVALFLGNPAGVGWPTYGLFAVFSWLAHKSLLEGRAWTGK
jgi:hypothetical protein